MSIIETTIEPDTLTISIKDLTLTYNKAKEAKSKALQGNPLIVELTKAQQWNGALPTYSLGEGSNFLLDMRK